MIIKKNVLKSAKMRPKESKTRESALHAVPAIAELGNCEVRLRYASLLQLDEII